MTDESDRFLNAIAELEAIADAATSDEARARFDAPTLQAFWRQWPHISGWAGSLWRALNEDLEAAASPPKDELDETGGSGGG